MSDCWASCLFAEELYDDVGVCSEPDVQTDSVFVACGLVDVIPTAQVVFTLMFQPSTVVDTLVAATVLYGDGQEDLLAETSGCVKTVSGDRLCWIDPRQRAAEFPTQA